MTTSDTPRPPGSPLRQDQPDGPVVPGGPDTPAQPGEPQEVRRHEGTVVEPGADVEVPEEARVGTMDPASDPTLHEPSDDSGHE